MKDSITSPSECKCFSSTYEFNVYKWTKPHHFFFGGRDTYPTETKIVTIQGNTIEEIESKRDEIKNKLREEWDKERYVIRVYIQ